VTESESVRERINELVSQEHELRERLANGEITVEDEHRRLAALETELDQIWDLLRQRQARREFGQDPDAATTRSGRTVEGYLQ
jgi:hypothetical protein